MLTGHKKKEIRKLFARVNVTEICRELNVDRSGVYRTLGGRGMRFDELSKVVAHARQIIKERTTKIQSL